MDVEIGRHDLNKIRHAAGVIVSPGVPPDAPVLTAARHAGVEIVSELDLGFRALAALQPGTRSIAITGTNGKTTTTALVAHLLSAAGLQSTTAGNIGRPVTDLAMAKEIQKTTVYLDAEVYRRLKSLARARNIKPARLLREQRCRTEY